jgi:NAD kinase
MTAVEKLVIVTRQTRLEELLVRFNTRGQARFYITHAGADFTDYEREHDAYHRSLDRLRRDLDLGCPRQYLDRGMISTYSFQEGDVVVVMGQDGLVANVAKYAAGCPVVGVNPDPARFDGILLPFQVHEGRLAVEAIAAGRSPFRRVTLAEAVLGDGQRLLAFNDIFVGARSHVSARYTIDDGLRSEVQSSSGVLISTGAGSSGWMSSVFNMAAGIARLTGGQIGVPLRLEWEDPRLLYAVREPFRSRHSDAELVAGVLEPGSQLKLESRMAAHGVIFSDGMEEDFLAFNAGALATIRAAGRHALLAVPEPR